MTLEPETIRDMAMYKKGYIDSQSALQAKLDDFRNKLEDVVNELDLSESAIEKHGQEGTPPAELVKLVLAEKDNKIRMLKLGMVEIKGEK